MKRLRKLLVASLALTLCLTSVIPAFAQTDTTQEANATGQKEATVTINAGSNFKVTVPSTITVNQPSKAVLNESYNVKIEGDINGAQKIKVVPDSSFNLTQSGKSDVPVTVTQTKTDFTYDEINVTNGCTTTGTLTTTNEVTAGTWTGNLQFNINVETQVIYDAGAGLYTTGTDTMIKSWAELLAEDTIHVNEGVLTSNYDGNKDENSSSDALAGDLVIDSSVTTIGENAFYDCYSLTSVTIPDSVTTIGNEAFSYCRSLTSVTIPDSVTTINQYVFYACDSLTSVTIPDSVTTIGDWAFASCDNNLGRIDIPNSVTTIGANAFTHTMAEIHVPASVTSIGYNAFGGEVNPGADRVVYYGDNLQIFRGTLGADKSILSFTIAGQATDVGNIFYECSWLTSIEVSPDNNYLSSENGVLFNKDKTKLIAYPCGKEDSTYTIPDTVTEIGEKAFYWCSNLTSITIPDSVTTIGSDAFKDCYSLTSVTIPDGVNTIGYNAFYNVPHIEYHGTADGSPWGANSRN